MPKKSQNLLLEIICFFFIFLFTYTAIAKLIDLHKFRIVLSLSPIINTNAKYIAIVVPIVELFVALLLSFKRLRHAGLIMSLGLMVSFSVYIAYLLAVSSNLPCSCGGVVEWMSWKQHLIFNITLTLLAIIGIYILGKQRMKFLPNNIMLKKNISIIGSS